MTRGFRSIILTASVALTLTWPGTCEAAFVPLSEGGDATTASIQDTINDFLAALGTPNNLNNPGPIAGGRREINWDGGGSTDPAPAGTPFNGFLNTRGARFTTSGTGFTQTPIDDLAVVINNPTYTTTFNFFSPVRIFTPLGNNITDVTFFIPGTNGGTPATVSGFGAIFSDVDLPGVSKLEFFDSTDVLRFTLNVPEGDVADGSLSFAGVTTNADERIFRVRITTGNTALGPNDAPTAPTPVDVVVLDDFFYAEPVAIPEPASFVMFAIGCSVLGAARRLRRTMRSSESIASA